MARGLNQYQVDVMNFFAAIQAAYHNLSNEDRKELETWESRYGSVYGSSAWPRWKEFIPKGIYVDFSAIKLQRKLNTKKTIPREIRWLVWERDDFTCRSCGARTNLSVDHIFPESKGGALELDNLQTLCKPCNSVKGDRVIRADVKRESN